VAASHGKAERCRSRRRKTAVGFGSGARELAKGLEERNVETRVVLVRARAEVLGLHCGLSTVTMRCQPSRAPAAVARARKDSRECRCLTGCPPRDMPKVVSFG
jgi:hypothetical protein